MAKITSSKNPTTKTTNPTITNEEKTMNAKTTNEKPAKQKKSPATKLFSSVSSAERSLSKFIKQATKWGLGAQVMADEAMARLIDIKTSITELPADWKPVTKRGGSNGHAKTPLAEGVKVYLKTKLLVDYAKAFSGEDLNNLFVDRIVGTKALVRIGEKGSLRVIGFEHTNKLTTARPEEYPAA